MEMQSRIDAGMSPDEAYYETRDFYASSYDNYDRIDLLGLPIKINESPLFCGSNGCDDLEVCSCDSDMSCECKNPLDE